MQRTPIIFSMAALLLLLFGLIALGNRKAGANSRNSAINQPEVKIDNFSFTPTTLTVPAGTKVTWTNGDDVPHTVTSSENKFGSKALDTDDQFSYSFTEPGTYEYFCALHPRMTAKVIVQEAKN